MDEDTTRVEITREVNRRVLEIAAAFDGVLPLNEMPPVAFLCECGCFGWVEKIAAAYANEGGVWLEGHKPA